MIDLGFLIDGLRFVLGSLWDIFGSTSMILWRFHDHDLIMLERIDGSHVDTCLILIRRFMGIFWVMLRY